MRLEFQCRVQEAALKGEGEIMKVKGRNQFAAPGKRTRGKPSHVPILVVLLLAAFILLSGAVSIGADAYASISFSGQELLGRPTDSSISIKVVPDAAIEYYYEYGVTPGSYGDQTATQSAAAGQPHTTVISGLQPDTKYYYRMQYRQTGGAWEARAERSFWTQRALGEGFTFDITSDSHVNIMLGNASTWTQTMNRVAADQPDFLIDLGDTFGMDYYEGGVTTVAQAEALYLWQRDFFDLVSHSASIFLLPGNHEQREGWHGYTASSLPVMGTNAQKKFYLTPVPDGFYSGNTEQWDHIDGDQLLEDYYAWEWGDALFVCLDPYWYTTTKPFVGTTGGGEEYAGSGDRWDWTLGKDQFDWLKATLQGSEAKYKFVFAHHMTGGSDDYVRGGANPAHICEWGGHNEAGTVYEWATKRPGWGEDPVHQIFMDNQVSAFFHGHDHQYAYEMRDEVVYVSMPAAGFSGSGFNIYATGDRYTIQALPSPGHLRVNVAPSETTVEYVSTTSGAVNHTFTIDPSTTSTAPVVSDIPDQTIEEGETFATFDLDNYVTDPDNTDAELTWTHSGNSALSVNINSSSHVATITASSGWNGSETITFRATDPDTQYDEDSATFTVNAPVSTYNVNVAYTGPANPVGGVDTLSVRATVLDDESDPVSGVNLGFIFDAQPGSNGIIDTPPVRGTDLVTNASGQATFTWTEGVGEYGTTLCYAFIDADNDGVEDAGEVRSTTISITISEDEPPVVPDLAITAPTGLGSYASGDSFTLGWSADVDLDTGQFGIWARSVAGTWHIGQLVTPGAGDDVLTYQATVSLSGVPTGWYQMIVGYRPTVGSGSWTSFATSYGFVFSVGAPVTPTVNITVPAGQNSYLSSQSFTASWTASPSVTTGQFAVWVRSPDNDWYWMSPLVAANGSASYSAPVNLAGVDPGLGYQVIVAYEPVANTSQWATWATSPGVFSVDATAPTITITQPSGTGSYNDTQSVVANWTTNQTLSGGQFGIWVHSGSDGWYVTTLISAIGTAGTVYSATLPLSTVPDGAGNQVVVAYRPVVGTGAFMSWATSPGSFTVLPD